MAGGFPSDVAGWAGFLIPSVAAVAAAVAFAVRNIRRPIEEQRVRDLERLDDRFKNFGERVGGIEGSCRENATKIEGLSKESERLHLQFTGVMEAFGRQQNTLDRLATQLEAMERERSSEDRRISERLTAIETKMDLVIDGALKRLLSRIRGGGDPE